MTSKYFFTSVELTEEEQASGDYVLVDNQRDPCRPSEDYWLRVEDTNDIAPTSDFSVFVDSKSILSVAGESIFDLLNSKDCPIKSRPSQDFDGGGHSVGGKGYVEVYAFTEIEFSDLCDFDEEAYEFLKEARKSEDNSDFTFHEVFINGSGFETIYWRAADQWLIDGMGEKAVIEQYEISADSSDEELLEAAEKAEKDCLEDGGAIIRGTYKFFVGLRNEMREDLKHA